MHLLMRRKLAHSVNAFFGYSTSCRTVQPCLRRGRDTTPDRENQRLLGIADQVWDQRRPGICWQPEAATALEQVISAGSK
jgi:hypothetical protein